MDEIITLPELRALVGYRQAASIKQWLKNNGIPYLTDKWGRPMVNRLALRQAMGVQVQGESIAEPDWSGVN